MGNVPLDEFKIGYLNDISYSLFRIICPKSLRIPSRVRLGSHSLTDLSSVVRLPGTEHYG